MSLGMVRTAQRDPAPQPRALIALLALLIMLGVAGTTASIMAARGTTAATTADVQRNRELLLRVEQAQYALCIKIDRVARRAGIVTEPCPLPRSVRPTG